MAITSFNKTAGTDNEYISFIYDGETIYVRSDNLDNDYNTLDQAIDGIVEHFFDGSNGFGDEFIIDRNELNVFRREAAKMIENYDEDEGELDLGELTVYVAMPMQAMFTIGDDDVKFTVTDDVGGVVLKGHAKTLHDACKEICDKMNKSHILANVKRWDFDEDDLEEEDDNEYSYYM